MIVTTDGSSIARACLLVLAVPPDDRADWLSILGGLLEREPWILPLDPAHLRDGLLRGPTLLLEAPPPEGEAPVLVEHPDVMVRLPLPPRPASGPVLCEWIRVCARLCMEKHAMRRLIDRFEDRIRHNSGRIREADLLEEVNGKLRREAERDGLTGLANRRTFDLRLASDWLAGLSGGLPLALLMADIDRFKRLNDSLGHPEGDRCLRAVAQALETACEGREGWLAARYGGEEFVVLMPGVTMDEAVAMAERLRGAVSGLALPNPGGVGGIVTLSVGVARTLPCPQDAPEDLLRAADARLYEAKRSGRDGVRLQDGLGPSI